MTDKLPSETEMVLLRYLAKRADGSKFTLLKQRVGATALECSKQHAGRCLRRLEREGYLEKRATSPRGWRMTPAGMQFLSAVDALRKAIE
jgi:CTP-dependent riboflavin kinase